MESKIALCWYIKHYCLILSILKVYVEDLGIFHSQYLVIHKGSVRIIDTKHLIWYQLYLLVFKLLRCVSDMDVDVS